MLNRVPGKESFISLKLKKSYGVSSVNILEMPFFQGKYKYLNIFNFLNRVLSMYHKRPFDILLHVTLYWVPIVAESIGI